MKSRLFACVIILLAIQMSVFAATVRSVPTNEYPTIASAVNACDDGDWVIVKRISSNGGVPYTVPAVTGITIPAGVRELTIQSYTPTDPCCVADTVIDCGNSGRAFTFVDDQDCNVVVTGFTIINGMATGPIGADGDLTGVDPTNPDPDTWAGESIKGDGYGGAIYVGSVITPGVSIAPVIKNCVFQNCHIYGAVGGVGAPGFFIYTQDPVTGVITIEAILPGGAGGDGDGNGLGGAIYCGMASTPTIVDCNFADNFAHGGIGGAGGAGLGAVPQYEIYASDGGDGGDGIGDGQGGVIYADQLSDPNITRCTFTSNTVTVGLGGQGGQMGNSDLDPDNPATDGSQGTTITNNMRHGGAVYYNTQSSNNLNSSTFEHNDAGESGGAIYCATGSILNINAGCVFNHNQALNGSGGAIEAEALCIFDINDTKFLSNYAMFDGGAINTDMGCDIHISHSSLNANTAGVDDGTNFSWGNGGAISTISGSVLEINSCSFGLNEATEYGGAISLIGDGQFCKVAMYSTSVISNEALIGGGVYFENFQPIDPSVGNPNPDLFTNCTFISNLAEDEAGGIYLSGNRAGLGSRVVDCDITDNSTFESGAYGGGVYASNVEVTFENCRILRNSSSGYGGGIYFFFPGQTEVKNCLFVDNSAVYEGSAISSEFNLNYSVILFTNNTFSENTITSPTGTGGAVYNNFNGSPVIENCIFNQCNKVAVYESDENSQSVLNNNLFYSNPDGDYRVYVPGGETVYTGKIELNGLANANANIDDDPNFVSGDLGDYYLSQTAADPNQPQSMAVDAGSTSAVNVGLENYTTRTDSLTNPTGSGDAGMVDLGYHSPKTADMPVYHLNIEIVNPYGTVTTIPVMENNDFYSGTVVTLVANPNFSYRVAYWDGTESDSSTELTNTVIMNSDKTVIVEFETPKVLKVKSDGGDGYYSDIRDALFAAQDGDVIEVYKGVYRGPVIELYKNVHIRSRNPNDPLYVADTIIDRGGYRERAFWISGIIDNGTVIDGLTMINAGWSWLPGGTPRDAGFNGGDGPSFQGGCIYIHADASPIIRNCIIRNNEGEAGDGGNGHDADATFNAGRGGWGGWSRGGAVYCGTDSAPQFINCTFQDNRAIGGSGGNGGDFHAQSGNRSNYGGNWSTFMSFEFRNIDPRTNVGGTNSDPANSDTSRELWEIWDKSANPATDPMGMFGTYYRSEYTIDDTDYLGYYGDYKWYGGYGGAVYCGLNSDVNFINCEITGNTVVSGMSGLGGFYGPKRYEPQISYELPSFGAGVYCDRGSNTLFENCIISNNVASQMQGRYRLSPIVSHGGGVCSEDTASVIFKNCHINENQADIGGGIHFADSNPVIEDSNIVGNIAMQGGGIYGNYGVADIIGCNIIGNESRALIDPNLLFITDGSGGGIHISSLDVNIVDCNISENLAEYSGGGLFFDGGEYQSVINCLITDNIASHDGGGIAVTTWADPTISNCTIVGNRIGSLIGMGGSSEEGGSPVSGLTTYGDDLSAEELSNLIILDQNSPPPSPESIALHLQVQPVSALGDVVLASVPTSTWTYGCSATAAGMVFGYYDRNGYPNMYTGPTNGGVVPLTNLGQGADPNNPIAGSCSIIATQNGVDGRTTNGHVDDYWIAELAEGPDPWEVNGTTEHQWGSCTADFMGTSQWKWDWHGDDNGSKDSLPDGGTWFWFEPYGEKIYNFIPPSSWGLPATAGCHGMRLFAESRSYIVTENYNQMVDTYAAGGFSFEDYKAEIDAGYPVLITVTGHSMTGVGYNDATQEIILHNTWDNRKDRMEWGGYYEYPGMPSMLHLGITVIHLEASSYVGTFGAGIDVSNGGSANIVNSIVWDNPGVQISVGVEEEPASVYVTYSNIGPGDVSVYADTNCFIEGWDPNMYPDSNGWAPYTENRNQDPLFMGDYLLSQISAGQLVDSPSVDTGSDFASVLGFDGYTTRTDSGPDEDIVDMGYHHPMFDTDIMELNFIAITDPDINVVPVIDPCGITYYTQYTTVTLTVSDPPANYQVQWGGSDNDNLTATTNTVHMNTNKTVVVGFVKNSCILDVSIVGGNGSYEVDPEPDANGVYPRDTVVTITAAPDGGYRVKQWSGTDDDTLLTLENTVVMDGDKIVTIEFETPGVISVPGGDAGALQAAIDTARELDTIILASGTYRVQEGFTIIGKNITIASSSPDDPNCVAGTIIEQLLVEGGSHGRAFTFIDVGPQAVLNGITIRDFSIRTVDGDDGDSDPNTFSNMSGRNSGTNAGVALVCSKASPTIKNCRFVNCNTIGGDGGNGVNGDEAQNNGGMGGWPGGAHGGAVAMYIGWDMAGEEQGPSNPTFINCDFIDCSAQGGDGGNGGDGFEDNDNYIYGDAGLGGGWYYGEPYSYYSWTLIYWPFGYHFDGRGYDGQYDEYTRYSGLGGAVFVGPDCSPVFKECYFEGNRSYGGSCGINGLNGGWDLIMTPAAPLRIDSLGGAVYCDSNSTPYFYDCDFVDNEADVNVPADNDKPFISYGGAVAARDNAKPTFKNCSFTDNLAAIGGGMYCGGIDAKIIDCNFVNNSAFHGGGLYYADGDGLVENTTIVYNSTIQPPDANIFPDEIFGLGGGLYITAGNTEVVDCNISMNSTGASGGGVYFSNTNSSLRNCLITSNTAERDGGGISANWLSQLNVSNCTVANNMIAGINFPSPYNYGGGLYCGYGSYTNIINSIFWNNTASSGHQLAVASEQDGNTSGSTLEVSYSIVLGGETAVFVANECDVIWGPNNLYVDPFFASGFRGDYFLSHAEIDDPNQTEDSPAIDAGSADATEFGLQAYTTRTDGKYDQTVVDMGYHYSIGDECRICDLDNSGKVEFGDLAILAQYWLYLDTECTVDNSWCQGANLVADDKIDFKDYSRIAQCWMVTASGMTAKWLVEPYTQTTLSIAMEAKTVINSWGWDVEYYFECINDGDANSNWQEEPEYIAAGLQGEVEYCFRFKVRDLSPNFAESDWSDVRCALTGEDVGDITPPEPNPMTWEIEPTPTGPNSVEMRASLAIDDGDETNLVYYEFIREDPNGIVFTVRDWHPD
ncbi:MAG: right-handed parallel beta-helix repeat-containing protein, partial [Planctomycetes bacterium]|nr:right-handed parallel beta-helix repeat-containing protein [Planctomycetota bacterium]